MFVIRLHYLVRFVVVYRGPSHTFKLQRLSESSRYCFRIQAVSEAGEGPFSETYTFSTTKSLPQTLKGTTFIILVLICKVWDRYYIYMYVYAFKVN